ncbi:hypothetical protein BDB00DRAFT_926957 [Zychaea mexicana]|uniref:uncharacterized protein n=1 Tax=Zychaea mexicana TaxID=64656 RepID=UPI0022FF15A9|nr:uncharacterized protein BDB00DRAFT_926957 [Zychaea mexicana]KAI9496139.1 hypothetical protein BDB00DRAFT_926957 [Zychaea mexicana]
MRLRLPCSALIQQLSATGLCALMEQRTGDIKRLTIKKRPLPVSSAQFITKMLGLWRTMLPCPVTITLSPLLKEKTTTTIIPRQQCSNSIIHNVSIAITRAKFNFIRRQSFSMHWSFDFVAIFLSCRSRPFFFIIFWHTSPVYMNIYIYIYIYSCDASRRSMEIAVISFVL